MLEDPINKIKSEVLSIYTTISQQRPNNDIACRTKIRQSIQSKLQTYVDKNAIDSFLVLCDETNNSSGNLKQPINLEVFVKTANLAQRQRIISLPTTNQTQPANTKKPTPIWSELNEMSDVLWNKFTRKKK